MKVLTWQESQRVYQRVTPRIQESQRVISELPEPRLKGNFPEEEMQIMAYLAKECLLLEPDAHPTMSEVVQILSTIAPDKNRRRNIPQNLFQMSSASSMKSEPFIRRPDNPVEAPIDLQELRRVASISSSWTSQPLDINRTMDARNNSIEADTVSAKYMEKLILPASNARSIHASNDETVDLTEPRFESFYVANVSPPGKTLPHGQRILEKVIK